MTPWFQFLLGLLATWRVTHLLSYEDGPADLVAKLRVRLGSGFLGRLIECFMCLSLWVALPFAFAIGRSPSESTLMWLALSGGACLLERFGREPVTIRELPAPKRDNDGMLWTESRTPDESVDGHSIGGSASSKLESGG